MFVLFLYFFTQINSFCEGTFKIHDIAFRETDQFKFVKTEKKIAKTCLLIPDKGPCRAAISMFYFDPSTLKCAEFTWGGCQGNGNRFDSEEECMKSCINRSAKHVAPRYCSLTFDYGYCFGGETRWYFDKLYKVCKKTLYSGCGGNKNNFYNKEQCDQVCRFGNMPKKQSPRMKPPKKVIIINPWDATTTPQHVGITSKNTGSYSSGYTTTNAPDGSPKDGSKGNELPTDGTSPTSVKPDGEADGSKNVKNSTPANNDAESTSTRPA